MPTSGLVVLEMGVSTITMHATVPQARVQVLEKDVDTITRNVTLSTTSEFTSAKTCSHFEDSLGRVYHTREHRVKHSHRRIDVFEGRRALRGVSVSMLLHGIFVCDPPRVHCRHKYSFDGHCVRRDVFADFAERRVSAR